ncbi:MAG TPA: DNA (cytosine-5-)-methyltransferase [Chitinophagaceae bacterium]|nr:DNA (cytosine-5-)-methyltransferase [Chitinophagaceae bacterium]
MKKEKVAIDLYSGIGGWTLGFKMAGVPVLASYEWWKDANRTHNKNFNTAHKEVDIRTLSLSELPLPGSIDYVVGSPPCTQFSLSNRGGKGDIADGLIDIYKFLEVVEHLQPIYWAMENVPRVATILKQQLKAGPLERFAYLFGDIRILKASDFGVPQDRKRMIAGRLPFDLLESYKKKITKHTLGEVLKALEGDPVVDPIYGIQLQREQLTDHILEAHLSAEERRINQETKSHHPVYNLMSFPDRLDRPSRTITAVCTRVSRESIVIEDALGNVRRLTVRERGVLQSFPINYQYFGSSYNNKIKMIGNAVPPLLTFYIAQAMQEVKVGKVKLPDQVQDRLQLSSELAVSSIPDNQGAKYPWSRSFWMAIKGLRFGSGVRFELKNSADKETRSIGWSIQFHYGNSKNMKAKDLGAPDLQRTLKVMKEMEPIGLWDILAEFQGFITSINAKDLQSHWSNEDRSVMGPIELIDTIASYAQRVIALLSGIGGSKDPTLSFIEGELRNEKGSVDNKKVLEHPLEVFTGILLGSLFNVLMKGQKVQLPMLAKAVA